MTYENKVDMDRYNSFCKNCHEGDILYNVNRNNFWGDYLLVANISTVIVAGNKTYSMMLLGLKKKQKAFVPRNCKIKITPDYACNIPFLKYVGHCGFSLIPEIKDVKVNVGLATVYGETDLHKYAKKLSIRKPKNRKYGMDGEPVIHKT